MYHGVSAGDFIPDRGDRVDPAVEYHSHGFAEVTLSQACQLQGTVFSEQDSHARLTLRGPGGPGAGQVAVAQSNFGRDPQGSKLRFGTENPLPSLNFFMGSEPEFERMLPGSVPRLPGLVAG